MSGRSVNKSKGSVLALSVLLFVSLGLGTVTIGENTVIEQDANDVDIVAEEEFNVSELTVFDDTTQFGNVNFSVTHDDSQIVHANMTEFNGSAEVGETVTDFKANASTGDINFAFSNISRDQFFEVYEEGVLQQNTTTGEDGEFTYSSSVNDGFEDYRVEASAKDKPEVSFLTLDQSVYGTEEEVEVSGSVTKEITGEDVADAELFVFVNGDKVIDGVTTDSDGDFVETFESFKTAGEFEVEVVAEKFGENGSATTSYTVDEFVIEDPRANSTRTDEDIIDVQEAANLSLEVFRNNQEEIDEVLVDISGQNGPAFGDNYNDIELENTTSRDETQRYFAKFNESNEQISQDIRLGVYEAEFEASSTLNGDDIEGVGEPNVFFELKNITSDVETDRVSYGLGTDSTAEFNGTATLQPDDQPVSDADVNVTIINASTGELMDYVETQTDGDGEFSGSKSIDQVEGLRELNVEIENEDGIRGFSSTEYSVTELNVDSLGFVDSERLHAYNVTGFISDSQEITDPDEYECSFEASDSDGNSETYIQDIVVDEDDQRQAECTQPYIAATNNSEWDDLEELEVTLTATRGDVSATRTSTRALPNNAPKIINDTDIELEITEDKYRFDIEAAVRDGDIPGETEVEQCEIRYRNEELLEFDLEGNLDESFGEPEDALCSISLSPDNASFDRGDEIDAELEFTDEHDATTVTSTVDSPAVFQAEVIDFDGNSIEANFTFIDGEQEIGSLSTGADGEILDSIDRNTDDLVLEAINKEFRLKNIGFDNTNDLTFRLEDDPVDFEPSEETIREVLDEVATFPIDLSHSGMELTFEYEDRFEPVLGTWECNEFDTTVFGGRNCETDETDELLSEPSYIIDSDKQELTMSVDSFGSDVSSEYDGSVYLLTDNSEWKDQWLNRREITIEGQDEDLFNYQINLNINTRELVRDGILNEDCNNVRFFDTNQDSPLDHWVNPDECGEEDTNIWVQVPYIPSDVTRTLFMYSGREDVSDISSGDATFEKFDDFSDGVSGYNTEGDVSTFGDSLLLRAREGEDARIESSDTDDTYRFVSEIERFEEIADTGNVSTFRSSSGEIKYNIPEDRIENEFDDQFEDTVLDTNENVRIYQETTENEQNITVSSEEQEYNQVFNTDLPADSATAFAAELSSSGEEFEEMEIDRWFTAKFTENEPEIQSENQTESWRLWLLDGRELLEEPEPVAGNLLVDSDQDFEIKANSSSRNSDVDIYIDGEKEFEAVDSDSLTRTKNETEERSYKVTADVDIISENLTGFFVVGTDDEDPDVELDNFLQSDGGIDIEFEARDNYEGYLTCQAIRDTKAENERIVEINESNQFESSSIRLPSIPEDEPFGVRCYDQTGNSDEELLSSDIDTTSPNLSVNSPEATGTQIRARPEIEFSAVDVSSETIGYEVRYRDGSGSVSGTMDNDSTEVRKLPEPNSYGETDLVFEVFDNNQFTSREIVTFTLEDADTEMVSPEPDISSGYRDEGRNIRSPRIQTDQTSLQFEVNHTTEAQSTTTCRLYIDGEQEDTVTADVNQTATLTVTDLKQKISMPAEIECDTEAGSTRSDVEYMDSDREAPEINAIFKDPGNQSNYGEETEHSFTVNVGDNLEAPEYTVEYLCRNGCSTYTTDSHPYLRTNGVTEAIVIENNFTGTTQNDTIECKDEPNRYASECTENHIVDSDNIEDLKGLDSGVYSYRFYVQDLVGNMLETDERKYVVEKTPPFLDLDTQPRARNGQIINGTSPEVVCSAENQETVLELERNDTGIIDSSSEENVEDMTVFDTPDQSFSYSCSIGETSNFEAGFATYDVDIVGWGVIEDDLNLTVESPSTATTDSVDITEGKGVFIDETEEAWNVEYGGTQTITTDSRSGEDELYFNGEFKGTQHQEELVPDSYDLKVNSTGGERFDSNTFEKTLNIEQATPDLDISSNASFSPEVGEFFELKCSSTTSQNDLELLFDEETIDSGATTDEVSSVLNASEAERGTYTVECLSDESQNFTSNNETENLTVETNTPDMNFDINADGESVNQVTNAFEIDEEFKEHDMFVAHPGQDIGVTCSTAQGVDTTLERDGIEVESPYSVEFDDTDIYNFTCTSEETDIFDTEEQTKTLSIKERTETEIEINGQSSDITLTQDEAEDINISAFLNTSELVEIWEIDDPDYRHSAGTNDDVHKYSRPNTSTYRCTGGVFCQRPYVPGYNNVNGTILDGSLQGFGSFRDQASKIVPGEYKLYARHPWTLDHGYSYEEIEITVEDSTGPRIEDTTLDEGEWVDQSVFNITTLTKDFSEYTCQLQMNGGNVGMWTRLDDSNIEDFESDFSGGQTFELSHDSNRLDRGLYARHEANLEESDDHTFQISCEDEEGNTNREIIDFQVDTTPPEVDIDPFNGGRINSDTSAPTIQILVDDNLAGENEVRFETLGGRDAGTTIVEEDFPEPRLSSLPPGDYDIFFEAEDQAGNVETSETRELNISSGIYDMRPSNQQDPDRGPSETVWVGSEETELSFKYGYRDDQDGDDLQCEIRIDGTNYNDELVYQDTPEQDTRVGTVVDELEEGTYNWEVQCGDGDDAMFRERTFEVDQTLPEIRAVDVSRDSGRTEIDDDIRFSFQGEAKQEFRNASITADFLSTREMDECFETEDGRQCSFSEDVPPGEHTYSFTMCDAAGNCQTSDERDYVVLSEDDAMQLRLNNKSENITIEDGDSPVVDVAAVFDGGERGDVQFRRNFSFGGQGANQIAQVRDAEEANFSERFLENGTYRIEADFQSSINDGISTSDELWVTVNRTDFSDFGFNIINLPRGNASLRGRPDFSLMVPGQGISGTDEAILGEGVGRELAAQITVNLTERDLDGSDIFFNTDIEERKSVIDFQRDYSDQIEEHSLLVPRRTNSGEVLVCPRARSLDDIVLGCQGAMNISSGEEQDGITNTEVTVNGDKYYHIEGITGTGARELDGDTTSSDPADVEIEEQEILNAWEASLPEQTDLDVEGGNVTVANLSAERSTTNWAGVFGNASGDLILGTDDIFFEWDAEPDIILASNESVDWSTIQRATVEEIDRYYDMEEFSDSAENTFTETTTMTVAGEELIDAPSVDTYNGTQAQIWTTAGLSDGDVPVMAGEAYTNQSTAFTGELANYQMLIPVGRETAMSYSMFMEIR